MEVRAVRLEPTQTANNTKTTGIRFLKINRKKMLAQHKLGQKRHNKKLKRKHKTYAGPRYSALEQHMMWAPLLQRAGIVTAEPENSDNNTTSFV